MFLQPGARLGPYEIVSLLGAGGMGERGGCPGFLLEPMKAIDAGRVCGRQDLDRDVTSQPRIAGAIHLAHPAGPHEAEDLVRAEMVARL